MIEQPGVRRYGDAARGALQRPGVPIMPGSVQRPPDSPMPGRSAAEGGNRRHELSDLLIVNQPAAFVFTDITASFEVFTPSNRLGVLIGWTYEPNGTEDTSFTGSGWSVSADAWIKPLDRRWTRGNNLFTAQPLPWTWEAPNGTMVPLVRGTVTVSNVNNGSGLSNLGGGNLWVSAIWEPAPGWYPSDEELTKLFSACRCITRHGLTVPNGAG